MSTQIKPIVIAGIQALTITNEDILKNVQVMAGDSGLEEKPSEEARDKFNELTEGKYKSLLDEAPEVGTVVMLEEHHFAFGLTGSNLVMYLGVHDELGENVDSGEEVKVPCHVFAVVDKTLLADIEKDDINMEAAEYQMKQYGCLAKTFYYPDEKSEDYEAILEDYKFEPKRWIDYATFKSAVDAAKVVDISSAKSNDQ